ncbi:MAG TPA: hypothetical protein VF869_10850 [Jatrophihabitantaceae bacterium]
MKTRKATTFIAKVLLVGAVAVVPLIGSQSTVSSADGWPHHNVAVSPADLIGPH